MDKKTFEGKMRKEELIPVIVDDIKTEKKDGSEITRLSFLIIDVPRDEMDWNEELRKRNIDYFTMGPYKIIYKPIGDKQLFDDPDTFVDLYKTIEKKGYLVDKRHILLPNKLFPTRHKRANVYRIPKELFIMGFKAKKDKINEKKFLSISKKYDGQVYPSRIETSSYTKWKDKSIDKLIKKHKKIFDEVGEKKYQEMYVRWKQTKDGE